VLILSLSQNLLYIVIILDVNNFEEDDYADDAPETVARYIIDQLITSVTAPVGRLDDVSLSLSRSLYVKNV